MHFMKKTAVFVSCLLTVAAWPTHADVVTDWNNAALQAIRIERTSPPRASRNLAILHTAIYDAVNGISRRHETYFYSDNVPASASPEAAASAAAHKVLVTLFSAQQAMFDAAYAAAL